jgi:hypothetical protein
MAGISRATITLASIGAVLAIGQSTHDNLDRWIATGFYWQTDGVRVAGGIVGSAVIFGAIGSFIAMKGAEMRARKLKDGKLRKEDIPDQNSLS